MPEPKTCDPPHVIHNLVVSCIALCKLNRINHDRMCNFLTVIKFVSMLISNHVSCRLVNGDLYS